MIDLERLAFGDMLFSEGRAIVPCCGRTGRVWPWRRVSVTECEALAADYATPELPAS
jgi:hypothetical protein